MEDLVKENSIVSTKKTLGSFLMEKNNWWLTRRYRNMNHESCSSLISTAAIVYITNQISKQAQVTVNQMRTFCYLNNASVDKILRNMPKYRISVAKY